MNVYKHQPCPKAPKLLFLCSIQWFLFKQKKWNCPPWTKPEHINPRISQDLRRDALLLPCSPRAVSHTPFLGTNGAISSLLQQAACQQVQHTQERAAGQASWSAGIPMDRISHHSVLSDWSWDLILYSGHMGGRTASALLLSALCQPGSYCFNNNLKKAAAEHFEVLIIFLKLVSPVFRLECGICSAVSYGLFNERSWNKKASTFPEAIYIKNCRASSSGYKVPIMR